MNRYSLRLSATDWVLIGYVAGILLWFVADTITADAPDETRTWTEQSVTLSEDHLRRLEDGETVTVTRWHGNDLVLNGTVVVDVGEVEEGDPDR